MLQMFVDQEVSPGQSGVVQPVALQVQFSSPPNIPPIKFAHSLIPIPEITLHLPKYKTESSIPFSDVCKVIAL